MQHIYLSYPADEQALAYRLVDDLQDAGYTVFLDAVNEPGTMAWAAETRRAIRTCGVVIILLRLDKPRRRVGVRHEGILARRREKPVIVIALTPGDLPRYLAHASRIDFTGAYDALHDAVFGALPDARRLLLAPTPATPRWMGQAPPRGRRRKPAWYWALGLLVVLGVLVAVVIGLDLWPG